MKMTSGSSLCDHQGTRRRHCESLICDFLQQSQDIYCVATCSSRLNPEKAKPTKDPEVLSVKKLKAGQIIRGFVKSVGEQGVFIR